MEAAILELGELLAKTGQPTGRVIHIHRPVNIINHLREKTSARLFI